MNDLRTAAQDTAARLRIARDTQQPDAIWIPLMHEMQAAWNAYRAAAKASSAPRPAAKRGTQFESSIWIDYSHEPAKAQVTKIAGDRIYYRLLDCAEKPTGQVFYTTTAAWPASALPI